MTQEELFGQPKRRSRKRGWTNLDRLRARIERLSRRIEETGGSEKEWEARDDAEMRLALAEEEAREKWKNSFGS